MDEAVSKEMLLLRPNAHAVDAHVVEAPAVDAPAVDAHVVEAPAVDAHVVEAPVVEAEEAGEVTARGLLIAEARIGCNVGQAKTAQKMLSMNTKTIESFSVGDLVLVRLPDVDRGPITLTLTLVILSVREAVAALSVGHGQGYIKCQCAGSCATLRCSCRKAGIACSSKCHGKAFICKNNDALYEVVDEATVEATEDVMEAVVVEKVQTRKVTKAKKANNKTNKKANKK